MGVWKIGGFKSDGESWESPASSRGDSRRVPTMPISRDDDFVCEVVRALRECSACVEEEGERTTEGIVGETVEGREEVKDEKGMLCKGTEVESGGATSAEAANCASTTISRLLDGNGNVVVAMPGADGCCTSSMSPSNGTIATFRLCVPLSLLVMCFRLCFAEPPKSSSFSFVCVPFATGDKGG